MAASARSLAISSSRVGAVSLWLQCGGGRLERIGGVLSRLVAALLPELRDVLQAEAITVAPPDGEFGPELGGRVDAGGDLPAHCFDDRSTPTHQQLHLFGGGRDVLSRLLA